MPAKGDTTGNNRDLHAITQAVKADPQVPVRYLARAAVEQVTCLLSAVAVAVVCLILGAMILFFTLYALAEWIGALLGSAAAGFLIVAIILLVMAMVFFSHRQQWVVQPLARLMAGLFLEEEEEEEEIK